MTRRCNAHAGTWPPSMLCTEGMARKTQPPTTEPMGILTQLMLRLRNRGGVKTTQNQLAIGTGGGGGGGASDSAEKKCCVLQ